MNKPVVIFIVGPTSSGKTSVAFELALRVNGEIISCDSMQVYKDMDVLTRAAGEDLLGRVPHHLLRYISCEDEYNAARFAEEARKSLEDILARGKVPIIAAGTGLYMKALVDGIFQAPPKDEDLRKELEKEAEEKGIAHLYERLMEVDPDSARQIHPNDLKRVIRALEVFELTGEKLYDKKEEAEGISSAYDCRFFGMELAREKLYDRINSEVDKMFDEGLIEEVRALSRRDLSSTAGQALGIKEVRDCLEGRADMEHAREELKKNTRRYAKRQLTWFRSDERIRWLSADRDAAKIAEDILKDLDE